MTVGLRYCQWNRLWIGPINVYVRYIVLRVIILEICMMYNKCGIPANKAFIGE